jgi:hypothetical protein
MSHQPSSHAYKLTVLDEIAGSTQQQDAFSHASGMEDPLSSIRYLASALNRVAQAIEGDDGMIVYELARIIATRVDQLDDIQRFFFRLHHPDRERFERDGWPTEQRIVQPGDGANHDI